MNKENTIKKAKEAIQELGLLKCLLSNKINCIYVAGSLMEGFGNSESDIDIFVYLDGDIDDEISKKFLSMNNYTNVINRHHNLILNIPYDGTNIDIELYRLKDIESYINDVNLLSASLGDKKFDVLHRLKYGVPILNTDNFNKIKNKINYDKYNLLLPRKLSDYYHMRLSDIKGAFFENDFRTSVYMAINLFEETANAYLSIYGETNPGRKWFVKKIRRYTSLYPEKINLEKYIISIYNGLDFNDNENLKTKTLMLLEICQELNDACQLTSNREEKENAN